VFIDNDTSAFSGARRPAYQPLLAELAEGAFAAISAWDGDRLHRSTRELEDFLDVIETTGAIALTVTPTRLLATAGLPNGSTSGAVHPLFAPRATTPDGRSPGPPRPGGSFRGWQRPTRADPDPAPDNGQEPLPACMAGRDPMTSSAHAWSADSPSAARHRPA
jgi:site-specific DNA recombinase